MDLSGISWLFYLNGYYDKDERLSKKGPTKISPFFDIFLHFSIFLFEMLSIASQLSCKTMLKNLSENIDKCRRKSKKGPTVALF